MEAHPVVVVASGGGAEQPGIASWLSDAREMGVPAG